MNTTSFLIARMEFTATARLWWIRLFTVAYALVTVAMAYASGVIGETEPGEVFARLTVAVLPLALMLVPLASLLIGTAGAPDPGETAFLLAQPVTRRQLEVGCWLGHAAAVSTTLVIGLGSGGALVAIVSGAADFERLLAFVAACLLAGLAFLSMSSLIASLVTRRQAAMGAAAFVWFVAVIFYDACMLGLALAVPGTAGAKLLFVSVFGNVSILSGCSPYSSPERRTCWARRAKAGCEHLAVHRWRCSSRRRHWSPGSSSRLRSPRAFNPCVSTRSWIQRFWVLGSGFLNFRF
jgi:ABC-type transport system involved in multi-copper enzyme maturation permease subunit